MAGAIYFRFSMCSLLICQNLHSEFGPVLSRNHRATNAHKIVLFLSVNTFIVCVHALLSWAAWHTTVCLEKISTGCFSDEPLYIQICIHISYSMVVLYIGIMKVWGFWPEIITQKPAWYLLSDTLGVLVRLSQAQKCLQINPKAFH